MQFARNFPPQPGNCFVVMPFGDKELSDGTIFNWDLHYQEVLEPTIKDIGMTPIRADGIYGAGSLLEKLWQGIQQAEVVVADLTGRSPNVLYEVGLAHVIGKRILILTMDKDDVPVDLGEFQQIQYSQTGRGLLHFTKNLRNNLDAARKEPANEKSLTPLIGFSPVEVPAKVIHVTTTFAIVEADGGRRGFLSAEDISWTKLPRDLTRERILQGDRPLKGAFVSDQNGQQRYSLTALQENPWPRLQKEFPVGSNFRGVVASLVSGVGAFVTMNYEVRGLIPEFQLPRDIRQGSEVEAQVEAINIERRQVRLKFVKLSSERPVYDGWGPFHKGQTFEGRIRRVQPEQYVLVQITDNVTGLLPSGKMTPALRSRFLGNELKQGDYVPVEVVEVDASRRRVLLRDRRGEAAPPDFSSYQEMADGSANYEESVPA